MKKFLGKLRWEQFITNKPETKWILKMFFKQMKIIPDGRLMIHK